jgi:Domain of unknown function (DUF3402)
LKAIVAIASNLVPQPPAIPQHPGAAGQNNARMNGGAAPGRTQDTPNGANGPAKGDVASPSDNDVDEIRSREIAAKAVTGTLILLLKWLKLSRKSPPKGTPKGVVTYIANISFNC